MPPTKKTKLQFEFTDKALERLDEMVEIIEATSRAEVIRNALKLLDYTLQCKNGQLIYRKENGTEEQIIILGVQ